MKLNIDAGGANDRKLAKAIEPKLREQGGPVDQPVLRRDGSRMVVPAAQLLRLGDGRFDKGRRFVQSFVNQIRAQRVRRLAYKG